MNEICQQFPQLRHIKFPDIDNGKIGILLGTACVQFTHALEWIRGAPNCPAGVRTELGWTIAGEFTHPKKKKLTSRCHQVFFASHSPSPEIQPSTDVLENYWTIEKAGCEPAIDKKVSLEDKEALRILNETCRHNGERYEIGLPWKSSATLPNNYFAAVSQARSLEKRLKDKPITLQKYKETLTKDLALNYVEPVTKQHPPPDKIWYLPTHPVENPNKPGKIRRVANAASKFKGCSLNTCLLTGHDLLADLLELILRFREHAIGVLADIESMFMQIAIRKEDQSALRFVWLEDNLIRQYQYIRLIFGANCSPCCAIFVLRKCAADHSTQFPEVDQAVRKNFYMDDFIKSFPNASDARRLTEDLRNVLMRGGFRLTKFLSNNAAAIIHLPESEKETPVQTTRVLGQTWCLSDDTYTAPPPKPVPTPTTLRQLFSLVSSVFDPIGLLAPFVVQFKILLQSLWKRGQKWDQMIPNDLHTIVVKLVNEYRNLPHISVPRQLCQPCTPVQLHVFTDASISAFAAVIYARPSHPASKSATITFVLGKSRVAPLKQLSVPKLELEAALLEVRLLQVVRRAFDRNFPCVTFWTDSCVVLDWIQNQKQLKSFAAHRVNEISRSSAPSDWRYVPSNLNPADHGTRGLKSTDITVKWTKGPKFLTENAQNWPTRPNSSSSDNVCAFASAKYPPVLLDVRRFSSWLRLFKTAAQVIRFVRRLRSRNSDTGLITADFQLARLLLIRQSQAESFSSTVAHLNCNLRPSPQDKLLPYNPVLDDQGILRSAGRLKYAPLPESTRLPTILDAKNPLVKLLVEHSHAVCQHAGPEYVKAFLQQRYLIIGVRCALRSVSHRCFACRRFRAENIQPFMAPLPPFRYPSPDAPFPFAQTGIDLFGPIFIVNGKQLEKHYAIIFNCLVTRACHLESCPFMTSDSFLNAFRRFVARR